MGYCNRILLFVYALAVSLTSLGLIVLCVAEQFPGVPMVSDAALMNEVKFVLGRWETLAAMGVVFVCSVHLLAYSVSGSGKKAKAAAAGGVIVVDGKEGAGKVEVAVSAVEQLATKTATSVRGVREAVATLSGKDKVTITTIVNTEQSVSTLSEAIRLSVQKTLADVLGLGDAHMDVEVHVSEITNGTPTVQLKRGA